MINIAKIQDSIKGLVGWKQPINPDFAIVDAENQSTSSGQYYQDVSNLITIEGIKACMNYKSATDGQVNDYLRDVVSASVGRLMNQIFGDHDLLENRPLYRYEFDFKTPITNGSSFVGYEVNVVKDKSVVTVINDISLTFNGVTDVEILLFHSSNKQPVQRKTITTVANDTVNEVLNWRLENTNGTYYVGYLQDGLTAQAINRNYNLASVISSYNCSYWDSVKVDNITSAELFDVNNTENVSETWGLNFDVSAYRDYTDVAINNRDKFIYAMQLQVANNVLDLMAHSIRSNRTELINYNSVLAELNGTLNNPNYPNVIGVVSKLSEEVKRLYDVFKYKPLVTKNTLI